MDILTLVEKPSCLKGNIPFLPILITVAKIQSVSANLTHSQFLRSEAFLQLQYVRLYITDNSDSLFRPVRTLNDDF